MQCMVLTTTELLLLASVGHDIVAMSTFHSLVRHRGHHDGCHAACGAGNTYPSGAGGFTSGFHRDSCCPVICVSFLHVVVLSVDF